MKHGNLVSNTVVINGIKHNIVFDEESHIYKVNGVVKRSVTQIFKLYCITAGYNWLSPYYPNRGTRTHNACELDMQGWVDIDRLNSDVLPFLYTFQKLVFEMGITYILSETPCYDPEYDICGTPDYKVLWQGKETVLEIKTGLAPQEVGLQTAAYERMLGVKEVLVFSLADGGKVYTKGKDYHLNHEVWREINTGFFDLSEWKKDRKRRRMERIL